MRANESHVDTSGDHRLQRRVDRRFVEAEELAVFQIRDARCELEPEQGAERKDMLGITAAIGVVPVRYRLTLMIEQHVEHVQRLARGCGDQLGIEWPITIREVGVDLEARLLAVMRVQAPGVPTQASCLKELPVR